MVWMNKILKESSALTHSSIGLNIFLFNFWFHKSAKNIWLKKHILCQSIVFINWKKVIFPIFSCKDSQKLQKFTTKKRQKSLTRFKLYNLDLHGECKRKVWFLRVICRQPTSFYFMLFTQTFMESAKLRHVWLLRVILCHPQVHIMYVIKRCLHT